MKKLLAGLLITLMLLSFTFDKSDYDQFIENGEIGFTVNYNSEVYNYYFYKKMNTYSLIINDIEDGNFKLTKSKKNVLAILSNKWGEFRFKFDKEGMLKYVEQYVYKNDEYRIDSFKIVFEIE